MEKTDIHSESHLISKIDACINELVLNKFKLQKAYNYYNGVRDPEQFRYLEENFGIGNPTSIEFTPLIKKHVDSLIGEYIDTPILPKISCKDKSTLSKITRQKELEISSKLFSFFKSNINNQLLNFISGKNINDEAIEDALNNLIEDINNNFISDYEIAAQNVVDYVLQSRGTDLMNKLRTLLLDLITTGYSFYRVKPSESEDNLCIEVLNPLNTFVDRNSNSLYVKDGYRAVIRKWLTKLEILNLYGDELTIEAKEELSDTYYKDDSYTYIRSMSNVPVTAPNGGEEMGLRSGEYAIPGYPLDSYETFSYKLYPVYEVEWIEFDNDKLTRFEGVRIGQSIYILTGESKHIIRSKDAPKKCSLSIGGIYLLNRNNTPYSLVLKCAHLQDKYDIVTYIRDNVIANSGTDGDWVDLALLPKVLGNNLTERLEKFIAYKKSGIGIIDSSQDGIVYNNNTTLAGFTDSIKGQTIQAFDLVLQRIEEQTSSITGMFRERLNGITLKDAVSNVEAGARNSYIITKVFYQQMDTLVMDMLSDCLNIGKIVWKKGLTGVLILGDKFQKVFTALPENFTHTDYDIHIVPSTQIMLEIKNIQSYSMEIVKAGNLDIGIEALTARSLTELKRNVLNTLEKLKKENNKLSQLQQNLEEAQNQLKQYEQNIQSLQQKLEQLNGEKIKIDQQKLSNETDINWYKAKTERENKQAEIEIEKKRTEIEYIQLYDGNNYNDKIKK